MVQTDVIEGLIDDTLWFHYDLTRDVLYLRLADRRDTPSLGEETPDGWILLRDDTTNDIVGLTVVNWWKRFGNGPIPDSLEQIERNIEPWGKQLAA